MAQVVAIVAIVAMFLAYLAWSGETASRLPHKQEIAGSTPASATIYIEFPKKDPARLVTDMPLPERKPNGHR